MATVNGHSFDWESISVNIAGVTITEITSIEYSTAKDHQNNYGRGGKPVSYGRGKEEFSAKITLATAEVVAIQKSLPRGKNLTHIAPFNIIVAYQRPGEALITTDTLVGCRFKTDGRKASQGDANSYVDLDILPFDITFNS